MTIMKQLSPLLLPLLLLAMSCHSQQLHLVSEGLESNLFPPAIGQVYEITISASFDYEFNLPEGEYWEFVRIETQWFVDGTHLERFDDQRSIELSSYPSMELFELGTHQVSCYATAIFEQEVNGQRETVRSVPVLIGTIDVDTFDFDRIIRVP